jgi:hypothetical protein
MATMLVKNPAMFSGRVASKVSRKASVAVKAAARASWLPGAVVPAHLEGKLAGDYGFDPLNLGADPAALKWYAAAELIHSRTAMMAVAGILIPEALTKAGALNVPVWWSAGEISNETSGLPFGANIAVMHIWAGFVETKRWMDMRKPGSQAETGSFLGFEAAFKGTDEATYPGGIFDPLNMAKMADATKWNDLKVKEIRNGRLAMLAFTGIAVQHFALPGTSPLDNLNAHIASPFTTTFADNGVSLPFL